MCIYQFIKLCEGQVNKWRTIFSLKFDLEQTNLPNAGTSLPCFKD